MKRKYIISAFIIGLLPFGFQSCEEECVCTESTYEQTITGGTKETQNTIPCDDHPSGTTYEYDTMGQLEYKLVCP
jgi:hypothetical protein